MNCGDSPYLCFQSSERPVEKLAKRPVEDTDRGAFRWASVGGAQPKRRKVEEDSSTTFVGGLPRNCDDSQLEDVARKADAKPSACRCVAGKGYGFLDSRLEARRGSRIDSTPERRRETRWPVPHLRLGHVFGKTKAAALPRRRSKGLLVLSSVAWV